MATNYKTEAQRWAKELHTPTELSKGMTLTEIDEKQADCERKARIQKEQSEKQIIDLANRLKDNAFMDYAGQDEITEISDAITLIIAEAFKQEQPTNDECEQHEEIFNFIDNLIN